MDEIQERLAALTAAEFGQRIARAIVENPYSSNVALVEKALDDLDEEGYGIEWEHVKDLIDRIAGPRAEEEVEPW